MHLNHMAFIENAFELKSADEGGDETANEIVTKALADLTASVEDRVKAVETKAADRLDKLEAKLNRPYLGGSSENTDGQIERKAFESFARRGVERMGADEVKALTVSQDSAGGYLAPEQFLNEIEKNLVRFSPIRQFARVASTTAGEIILPKRTGTVTAKWVGETEARPLTQPAYGQQKFEIFELAAMTDMSLRLLEDAAFNMEGELSSEFSEQFGREEGRAFILGDGNGKPSGLLANTEIESLSTAIAAKVSTDDLIDLYHSLPGYYAANAVFAMNRATIGAVRKLKDADGRYLWTDSFVSGNPPTILGRPVVEFPDLPDVAAGAVPIVFADFSNFRIFDRVGLSVQRDPYTVADTGEVRFRARRRVGGAVSKAEAFRFLKVK
ncbi:phage major capsid protein [Aureimonas sp. AU20]|uniref:phage major capsid protein n=1 Tax=Aureimonas sp. AU20 TaxID=1349819 RepID=UPI0007228019|nr:phage major capsid protein [Aureimonas sp. AU20]ALN73587.1 hypothetical protein M673_12735 [Aureimonas sp. AU20]